jgi:hypothetical protein
MAYSFADEPEELPPRKKIEVVPPKDCKAVCEVPWPEARVGEKVMQIYLMVDETSTREEVKAEIDFFEDQLHLWGSLMAMSEKKAYWECLAYFEELLESH